VTGCNRPRTKCRWVVSPLIRGHYPSSRLYPRRCRLAFLGILRKLIKGFCMLIGENSHGCCYIQQPQAPAMESCGLSTFDRISSTAPILSSQQRRSRTSNTSTGPVLSVDIFGSRHTARGGVLAFNLTNTPHTLFQINISEHYDRQRLPVDAPAHQFWC
jgi:hypothetical protein